jgi:hypothetical protein
MFVTYVSNKLVTKQTFSITNKNITNAKVQKILVLSIAKFFVSLQP